MRGRRGFERCKVWLKYIEELAVLNRAELDKILMVVGVWDLKSDYMKLGVKGN